MNNLQKAAEKLKNGWCQGAVKGDGDKYCAVGALGSSILGDFKNTDINDTNMVQFNRTLADEYGVWQSKCYESMNHSPEARVLAQTIVDNYLGDQRFKGHAGVDMTHNWLHYLEFCDGIDAIIYLFNDQSTKDEVIQMFEKAAINYDEQLTE